MLFSVSEQSFKNYVLSSRTSVKDEKIKKKKKLTCFYFLVNYFLVCCHLCLGAASYVTFSV